MTHTDEMQKRTVPIRFPIAIVKTEQTPTAERLDPGRRGDLKLSGSQVLIGCVSALCTLSLFMWVVIKLWLFEP